MELVQERRPSEDHDGAQDERGQDPPKEHPVLQGRRDFHRREDENEDEHVVHRERLLDEVAGDELGAVLVALEVPEDATEGESERHPDAGPGGSLFGSDPMGLLVEET